MRKSLSGEALNKDIVGIHSSTSTPSQLNLRQENSNTATCTALPTTRETSEVKAVKSSNVLMLKIDGNSGSRNVNRIRSSSTGRRIRSSTAQLRAAQHEFLLPTCIPQSIIVFDSSLDIRQIIVKLIDKYIVSGSDFELNIASGHRYLLIEQRGKLSEMTDDECAAIFNQCIYSIIALMHDSFIRFQQTWVYEELRKQIL